MSSQCQSHRGTFVAGVRPGESARGAERADRDPQPRRAGGDVDRDSCQPASTCSDDGATYRIAPKGEALLAVRAMGLSESLSKTIVEAVAAPFARRDREVLELFARVVAEDEGAMEEADRMLQDAWDNGRFGPPFCPHCLGFGEVLELEPTRPNPAKTSTWCADKCMACDGTGRVWSKA